MQPIYIDIPKDLLDPATQRSYEGVLPGFEFESGADSYSVEDSAQWNADITNTGGALLVSGNVSARVETLCARCLEHAAFDVEGDIEGFFIIPGKECEIDDLEEDEFEILPESGKIDISPLIKSAILLDLPLMPLCKPDCKGICPKCGANLNNEGACNCETDDSGAKTNNPFAVLKELHVEE